MPHSSRKDVDGPMDAWDRQRLGLALLEIREHLFLLDNIAAQNGEQARRILASRERVAEAIRKFIDEAE